MTPPPPLSPLAPGTPCSTPLSFPAILCAVRDSIVPDVPSDVQIAALRLSNPHLPTRPQRGLARLVSSSAIPTPRDISGHRCEKPRSRPADRPSTSCVPVDDHLDDA